MSDARNHDKQLEDGIYIGNQVDKANLGNPIARAMVRGFDRAFTTALDTAAPQSIVEVGCGEGRLATLMAGRYGIEIMATDFSHALIQGNAGLATDRLTFRQASIYEMTRADFPQDVAVCCEVLEHLERPVEGVRKLRELGARYYVISVPNEPTWRVLNMLRGKYWSDWGNTTGHLNHWSRRGFAELLEGNGFVIEKWLNPFPWLMVLAKPA